MKRRRIDGVDISHHQEKWNFDWEQAKAAGVRFVYHKATEGTIFVDPAYDKRRAEVKAAGLPFGAYHFARPVVGGGKVQAEFFLKNADPQPGDMVPALDLEVNSANLSQEELTRFVEDFFAVVTAALNHKRGLLYTRYNLNRKPGGISLWVPRYNNSNVLPVVPAPFWTWTMWQFSNGVLGVPSMVPGLGHTDINTLHNVFPWAKVSRLRLPAKKNPKRLPKVPRVETDVERLIRIAAGQVGYHEGFKGGHWNNDQKFSKAVPGLEWSNFQPWCATFVSWVAMTAGLADLFPRTASTDAGAAWFKSRGQWSEYPAIGAQVFFGVGNDMNHTGLVTGYDADHVYTIEGNTNKDGSREGDGVYRKTRLRRDPYVRGYGYPKVKGGLKSADPNYHRSAQ